jgi:hypothetical protein
MRIIAAYDAEGNIHHVVVSPADAPLATVTTESGLLMTEVEPPEVIAGLDLNDAKASPRRLAKFMEQLKDLRVEAEGKGKLVRRKTKAHK